MPAKRNESIQTVVLSDGRKSYRVQVWDPRKRKLHRKQFRSLPEAKTWRDDTRTAIRAGTVTAPTRVTVKAAGTILITQMTDGDALNRSSECYKPAAIRRYEVALRKWVYPTLGTMSLSDVRRSDVQAMVDKWRTKGLKASTIANNLDPLRVIFRGAMRRDEIAVDPTKGLELPAVRHKRPDIADSGEAAKLIEALPESERALWATAFYGGLRRGELRAMRWSDVDFEAGVIRVERGWDDVDGAQETKTEAGERVVGMTALVADLLKAHRESTGRVGNALVFGRTASDPFVPTTVRSRARKAWKAAGLKPRTLHGARHSNASYLIEAGANDLELTATIGHTDVRTTKNIYGHLFEDSAAKVAGKLDVYLSGNAAVNDA